MNWNEKLLAAREWWENADTETRYLVVVGLSGAFSLLAIFFENSAPRETFHRVRIEQ
jgi:Flp pilus assembly protein protease CpaA